MLTSGLETFRGQYGILHVSRYINRIDTNMTGSFSSRQGHLKHSTDYHRNTLEQGAIKMQGFGFKAKTVSILGGLPGITVPSMSRCPPPMRVSLTM